MSHEPPEAFPRNESCPSCEKMREALKDAAANLPCTCVRQGFNFCQGECPHALAWRALSPSSPAPSSKEDGEKKWDEFGTGHGHVRPRRDGVKARCGGPAICQKCAVEASHLAPKAE